MADLKALAPITDPGALRVKRRYDRLVRKDEEIVSASQLAAEIDDFVVGEDGRPVPPTKPEGWTERQFRIARDARKAKREAPMYLHMAQARWEMRQRVEALRPAAPVNLNANVINIVRSVPSGQQYEAIDVTAVGDKDV